MNRLSIRKRADILSALVEGNSLRSVTRMHGISINTVTKLLVDIGRACADYHDEHVYDLPTCRVQCDEIWAFCYAKQKNVPTEKAGMFGYGDVWTWTAIDADSKLIVSYLVGDRSQQSAYGFMYDLRKRLRNRVQLTTDGYGPYPGAVSIVFEGRSIDYAIMQKVYATERQDGRYSPAKIVSTHTEVITGIPNPKHISTSYVERQNLTMRMGMRRFTRLTNGFSKKLEMHRFNVALHFTYYNFCKVHQSLRVTPAMEAGLSDHVWSVDELVGLLEPSVGVSRTA